MRNTVYGGFQLTNGHRLCFDGIHPEAAVEILQDAASRGLFGDLVYGVDWTYGDVCLNEGNTVVIIDDVEYVCEGEHALSDLCVLLGVAT